METIKNIFIDSLNGFAVKDIPLFIFQLLAAGFMAHLFQIILNKKLKEAVLKNGALIGITVALVCAVAKYSLPFSVLASAGILILIMRKTENQIASIGTFVIVILSVGCGVGSVVQTFIGFVLISLILLFLPLVDKE